jgi:hypothetical protein
MKVFWLDFAQMTCGPGYTQVLGQYKTSINIKLPKKHIAQPANDGRRQSRIQT